MASSTCWLSVILLISCANLALSRICPCSNPDLCNPISSKPGKEYFLFTDTPKVWKHFDWSRVTTVAVFGDWDDELLCYAHSKVFNCIYKLINIYDPLTI